MSLSSVPLKRLFTIMAVAVFGSGALIAVGSTMATLHASEAQEEMLQRTELQLDVDEVSFLRQRYQFNDLAVKLVPGSPDTTRTQRDQDLADATALIRHLKGHSLAEPEKTAVNAVVATFTAFADYVNGVPKAPGTAAETAVIAKRYGALLQANVAASDRATAVLTAQSAEWQKRATGLLMITRVVNIVLAVLTGAILAVGLLVIGARTAARLNAVVAALEQVAAGDLTVTVDQAGKDEIAGMSRSVNRLTVRLREVFTSLAETGSRLGESSAGLSQMAQTVAGSAMEASSKADTVSTAAAEVSINVQSVAAGSDEMGSSISEISQNAHEAARVATGAVNTVETTTGTMNKLSDSSREIGDVVRLITAIAEQTNLLALNATIEAARAGDAGKGFAVVADEVKQLAQETARATDDISRRVEAIQEDADEAGRAIGEIAGVIARINEYQTTIASAVEEQTASTQSINESVAVAASGSAHIAQSISALAQAAAHTEVTIRQASASADELAGMSSGLAQIVAGFRF